MISEVVVFVVTVVVSKTIRVLVYNGTVGSMRPLNSSGNVFLAIRLLLNIL